MAAEYEQILTRSSGITLIPLDLALLHRAAHLRASCGLKTPDALQLAAAFQSKGVISFVNQRAFRADAQVQADEGSVGFQALIRCPGEALNDQRTVVRFSIALFLERLGEAVDFGCGWLWHDRGSGGAAYLALATRTAGSDALCP